MTKRECRTTKEFDMTKLEKTKKPFRHLNFVIFQDAFCFAAPRHCRRLELAEARVAVSSFHMREFEDEPSSRSLAGSLLVAHPSMLDPNFRRTVLFISEHDPGEGALGVIINRPLDRERKSTRLNSSHTDI